MMILSLSRPIRVFARLRSKSRKIVWWIVGWAVGLDKLPLDKQLWLLESDRFLGRDLLRRFAPNRDLSKLEARIGSQLTPTNSANALRVLAWLAVHQGRVHLFPEYLRKTIDSGSLDVESLRHCLSRCSDVMHYTGNFRLAEQIEISLKNQIDLLLSREAGLENETAHFSAIGHIALLEYLTKAIQLKIISANKVSIVFGCYPVANRLYAGLWLDRLRELGVSVIKEQPALEEPNLELWPTNDGYAVGRQLYGPVEREWDNKFGTPSLLLPSDALETATRVLLGTCFEPKKWFVGLHLRSGKQPDRELRNSRMANYREAISSIIEAGGQVVLVGDYCGRSDTEPGYIVDLRGRDFSTKEMESLHLFVWASSRFFIGNLSGGTFPPRTFGTPTLWVDAHPVGHFRPPHPGDLFIPKLVLNRSTKTILSLSEMYSSEHSSAQTESPKYAFDNGYEIRDSSSEEIREAVKDMLLHKSRSEDLSPLDEWVNREASVRGLGVGARIAPSFLHKWSDALFPKVETCGLSHPTTNANPPLD